MTYRTAMMKTTMTLLTGLLLTVSSPAMAGEPTEFIKENAGAISELLGQEPSKARSASFSSTLNRLVDFRELAARALGEHWEGRSDEEKDQFLSLLQELLEANYKAKLEGRELGKDYKIQYLEEKARGDKAIVETKVVWSDGDESVEYKMLDRGDSGWVIYDIVIDDISLVESYRDAYTAIIEEEGWGELIARLEAKAKSVREDKGAN